MKRRGPPRKALPPPERVDWIGRALARAGIIASDEVEEALRTGRVQLEGKTVKQPLTPWNPSLRVKVDGREVDLNAPTHVLMFHKPAGAVTSHSDAEDRATVFDLLRQVLPPKLSLLHWHAIGRLDRGTTGLLLFTNDERVVTHVAAPSSKLEKVYVAEVGAKVKKDKASILLEGVELEDGPAKATSLKKLADKKLELSVTEGRNHLVKRMLGAVGLPVTALHRRSIGGIELDIPVGEVRSLSPEEIRKGLRFTPR